MTLQVQIHVPGIIAVNYPLQSQVISSYVRLSGTVAVTNSSLPSGTGYIKEQISPSLWGLLTESQQLAGHKYIIRDLTYYMDGSAVRQVSYIEDEITSYQFNDDYIGTVYGDQITAGPHKFTIVVTASCPENPGIDIYDSFDVNFNFDDTTTSQLTYLDKIAPQCFLGEVDHQIFERMMDYILTQRTEGALKNDIDFLANLYDLDLIPQQFIPFLAKTIGYDYFAGLLGGDGTIREELRYLPDWQKSVGTKESILVLLRAMSLEGTLTPLYLDLTNNILVPGVKRRYAYSDEIKVVSQTKRARFTFPLTQTTFVPSTVSLSITTPDGIVVASLSWDIILNKAIWQTFLATGWLVKQDGVTPTQQSDVTNIYADNARGGITITFNGPMKLTETVKVTVNYQYEIQTRPGRNTRLSEFFDVAISSLVKPNDFKAKDYNHVMDIIKRSKPLRTKLRQITFPISSADAYMVNATTVSSDGKLSNLDRLEEFNIDNRAVQLNNPMSESVIIKPKGIFSDGFLFTWEKDCNLFENRFGIFHSLALEPTLFQQPTKDLLSTDTLLQRGFALIVNDDTIPENDKVRYLRRLGFQLPNFTTSPACTEETDKLTHFQTIRHETPTSPLMQTYRDMVIGLDSPIIDLSNPVTLFLDVMDQPTFGNREGFSATWDGGSGLIYTDLSTGTSGPVSWDVDTTNLKTKIFAEGFGNASLTVFRPVITADVEALYNARPNLRNVTFELGMWYAIWDVEADFNATPIHLSVFFSSVLMNHQGDCCCGDLGTVTTTTPLSFNQNIGKTYQHAWEFDLEIYDLSTLEVVAIYHWSGGYWHDQLSNADLTVTLSPVNSGSWTDDLVLVGTVTFVGVAPPGIATEWGVRACPPKIGDNMKLDLTSALEDDFGSYMTHRGVFGPIDDTVTFQDVPIRSLFDHHHNWDAQKMAAYDGVYLRDSTVAACFVWILTPPSVTTFNWDTTATWDSGIRFSDTQMQFDVDNWDTPGLEWDVPNPTPTKLLIHHFPNKLVFESQP